MRALRLSVSGNQNKPLKDSKVLSLTPFTLNIITCAVVLEILITATLN